MKTISKRLLSGISTGALMLVMMVAPTSALSMNRITTDQSSSVRCERIQTLAEASEAKLAERLSAMQLDFQKRLTNIGSRHDAVDQKATAFRAERSDKFESRVAELRDKNGVSETQLAAIDAFETAIKTAETTRETAVDTARATYREALDQAVAQHQAELFNAAMVFQAAVKAAFTTAKANCADTAVAATLRSSIKTAREAFGATRKAEPTKSSIKQLAETRRTAVQAANDEYKKAMANAVMTLKTALEKQ